MRRFESFGRNSPHSEHGGSSSLPAAETATTVDGCAAQDPCTLLSAQQAEPKVGALATSPFRASDGSDRIPNGVDETAKDTDAAENSSMGGQALTLETAGPWDKVTRISGALFVYKGDAQIRIDVSAAGRRENDALVMAREIVPRIGHSLFDDARATVRAPARNAHLGHPCNVIPIPEVLKEQMT